MRAFRFGVTMRAPSDWPVAARRVEDLGFDVLTVADHLDELTAPFPALAAAATATSRLRLGTLVCNNDLRNPLMLAYEAAALDAISGGRFELGMGAGHAAAEYERAGIPFDSAGVRVARLTEAVRVVKPLLGGEHVTFAGEHFALHDAWVHPRPATRPPLLVGGGGRKVLALAAQEADIVGLTGLGPALAGGRHHAPSGFTRTAVDECLAHVRAHAEDREVEVQALVQAVVVTPDREADAKNIAARFEGAITPGDVLDCPFLLVGSVAEIVEELQAHRERWGISYFTVFEPALDAFAPIVAALTGE